MSEELNISEPINDEKALAGSSKKRKVTGWLRTKPIETIETTNEQEASGEDFKPVKEEALAGSSKKRVLTGWLRTKPIETIETTNEQEASGEDFKPVEEEADMVSEEQEAVTASKKRKYANRRKKAIGGKRRKKQPTRDQPHEKVVKEKAHTYTVAFVRHW